MSRYNLNEIRTRNIHDTEYRTVRGLLESVAPSTIQEVIASQLYDALRAAGHYPSLDDWRYGIVALALGFEFGTEFDPERDTPPSVASLLRDFSPYLPRVEVLPWRAGEKPGDAQEICVCLGEYLQVRVNLMDAEDYEHHFFDYCDPLLFEKLANLLAQYGVALDVEALA